MREQNLASNSNHNCRLLSEVDKEELRKCLGA